jgi:hypothetical protein
MVTNNKKWWNKKWGLEKVCGITHARLRPGKYSSGVKRCVHLSCGHGFYTKAILQWLNHKPTCPLCRKEINMNEFYLKLF